MYELIVNNNIQLIEVTLLQTDIIFKAFIAYIMSF